jgi:manganese transport protein
MIPALAVLAIGLNPTNILVLSQVVLSFGIPLALIPLVVLTGRRDIMGIHVNCRTLQISAWTIAVAISLMNIFLIYQQFFIS